MILLKRLSTFRLLTLGVVPLMVMSATLVDAVPAPSVVSSEKLTFSGHGFGHGRGMGQYGALGYAVNYGWSTAQILAHFYGGTGSGKVANSDMTVELLAHSGKPLVVTGPGLMVNSTFVGAAAVRLTLSGNVVVAAKGAGCGSASWVDFGTFPASSTTVRTTVVPTTLDTLLSTCESMGKRAYRGTLAVIASGGVQKTIIHLPLESYLRGVVPHELAASWGILGGGRGMQALGAQAVAARSFALASSQPSGARTCDTSACQVYDGAGTKASTAWTLPEQPLTDQAIGLTAGVVRTVGGAPARTEVSSSTGGFTAGGRFPAVVDAGDAVADNPNHSWATTLSLPVVASRLGVGTIRTLGVISRNGLGADGGRVTKVRVVTTAGVVRDFTGSQVRLALGLKSDWFSISGLTAAEARAVVRALYADLLLRPVDSKGLATWSAFLAGGGSQPALVASLTRSREYVALRVRQAYREVLGRTADAHGIASWTQQILAGVPVDDVQRRFFASQEFVARSGGTDAGYVRNMYLSILGRAASPAEVTSWTASLRHYGRAWVVNHVWFSTEAAGRRAGSYYQVFLKRVPDPAGQLSWARVLLSRGEGAVRVGIAGSAEYRSLALSRFP